MKSIYYKSTLILTITLFILMLSSLSVQAVPANTAASELVQPSDEKFKVSLHGDEWFNWVTTETDEVIIKDKDGFWKYGELVSGKLKAGKDKFKINKKPKKVLKHKDLIALAKKHKKSNQNKISTSKSSAPSLNTTNPQALTNAPQKILVLLVEFSNINMKYTDNSWNNTFFGSSGSTVNNYYKEISNGKFYFTPASETAGASNDGIIKVALNYPHPNTGGNIGYANQKIVQDSLTAANPYINYADFDTNNDGYISPTELHIVTVIAGYETSYGGGLPPSVWGHRWSTSITLDGKHLGEYTQQGEIHYNHMATIGIFCHELGHNLGLPDLYDYDGSSHGIGPHSLMAAGSWGVNGPITQGNYQGSSPTHLDAWSKVRLGFVNPVNISASNSYTVHSFNTGNYNVLKVPTSNASQYFLIENRQFSGFDKGLWTYVTKGGVAIWHIDEDILKGWAPNNDETHKGVDIEEANEGKLGYSQLDRKDGYYCYSLDHYYYSGNNTTFSPSTTPNSNLYNGTKTGITITSTAASSNSMPVNINIAPLPPPAGNTSITYNLSESAAASINIYNSSNNLIKTLEKDILKAFGRNSATWDGRDSTGEIVDDGIYTYVINAVDLVNLPATPASGPIIVNNAPLIRSVSDEPDPFTPTGSNTCTIKYTLSIDSNTSIKIYDSNYSLIKTLVNGSIKAGANSVTWDGKNNSGVIVTSDTYTYTIDATDTLGRNAKTFSGTITVDSTPPFIIAVTVTPAIFAPTGINWAGISYSLSENAKTTVSIYNSLNVLVKTLESNTLKSVGTNLTKWDGKDTSGNIVKDGTYLYKITAVDLAGLSASPVIGNITVRQSYPSISSVNDGPDPFAPTGSNFNTIKFNLSKAAKVTLKIYDHSSNLVKTLINETLTEGSKSSNWYGDNENGMLVESGIYTYKIDAVDSLGRQADQVSGTITIDLVPPTISGNYVDPDPFEPIE